MNDRKPSDSAKITAVTLVGVFVFAAYYYLMQTLGQVHAGKFEFTFFPVPRYTYYGELIFILLVIVVGAWHIKLAFDQPVERNWKQGMLSLLKFCFGIFLFCLPLIFRASAQYLMTQLGG